MMGRLMVFMVAATMTGNAAVAEEMSKEGLADTSRVYDMDEVVVITQPKEAFRLRLQPVSSSMFNQQEISRLGTRDLRELSAFVPSFTMPNYGSRLTSAMYIRGIGSRINNPAVGIYQDGIPLMSKSAFNYHTYELDRVDILRGPQGTLYGQNTEGGLVRLYSKNPMSYQGTDIRVGVGSRFYRNVEASHYRKLNEQTAFSLAGFYNGQNGFFRNTVTGDRADAYNEAGGKARFLWKPTHRLTIDYLADYQYVRQNGFPYGLLDLQSGKAASPATNRQGNYRRNVFHTGLNLRYHANRFDLFSTTSYQYLNDYMMMDQDYLPQDLMSLEQRQLQNAITQEFSLKSKQPVGGFWHWTSGVFLSYQWLKTDAPVYFHDDFNTMMSGNIRNGMINLMVPAFMQARQMTEDEARAFLGRMVTVNEVKMYPVPGVYRTPQFNLGLFHESNFDLTDRLRATIGLRYDYNHMKIDYDTNAAMYADMTVMGQNVKGTIRSFLNHESRNHFNQLLPKFGLTYRIAPNGSNIYATVSKGYRAGGFNIQMFSDILQAELQNNSQLVRAGGEVVINHDAEDYAKIANTISYQPEVSWNYEAGTHLNLFSNALQADFSAFYMRVHDQQLSVMAGNYGYGRMMVNAGKSYSCGIEAALRGSVIDNHLNWALSYGYTHAVFKEYQDEEDGEIINYKDKKIPYVPVHTLAAMADYRIDFARSLVKSLTIGANVNAQGKTYWDELNTYSQKFYAVAGAHTDANLGTVTVSLWGRNLTNTNYNTFAVDSKASGTKAYFAQRGNPFQMGVDVKVRL